MSRYDTEREATRATDPRGLRRWRKPYRRSRAFDASCRCHGGCDYCRNSRMHKNKRAIERLEDPQ